MSLHNRLTHSLKVEQVGVSLYSKYEHDTADLADIADLDAISAACLSHDIGHPPFGHAGEAELNEILICAEHRRSPRPIAVRRADPCSSGCLLEDGFEGNAQSFRVLAVLAVHRESAADPLGLDLTRASLAAASKYPWTKGTVGRKANKWGAYDCDFEILRWVLDADEADANLDAQVMDWADDISYAVHDIEDFYRNGLIPLDDYRPDTEAVSTFLEYVEGVLRGLQPTTRDAFAGALNFFPKSRFSGRSEDLAALDRMRSVILGKFIDSTTLDVANRRVVREPVQDALNGVLKQLIWFHIIDEPTLAGIQTGQRRVLRGIFESLYETALKTYHTGGNVNPTERELRRLPQPLRRAITVGIQQNSSYYSHRQRICRGVVDYIAGLSDAEAYQLHGVLQGTENAGHL